MDSLKHGPFFFLMRSKRCRNWKDNVDSLNDKMFLAITLEKKIERESKESPRVRFAIPP